MVRAAVIGKIGKTSKKKNAAAPPWWFEGHTGLKFMATTLLVLVRLGGLA